MHASKLSFACAKDNAVRSALQCEVMGRHHIAFCATLLPCIRAKDDAGVVKYMVVCRDGILEFDAKKLSSVFSTGQVCFIACSCFDTFPFLIQVLMLCIRNGNTAE